MGGCGCQYSFTGFCHHYSQLLPRIPKHLADTESWGNAIFLFVIVLVILYIGWLLLGRPLKGLFLSLIAVFSVSLLAQITAALPQVSYYGFESVFFSVIFGLIIRNVFRVPAWMKPAIQSEFFIKIGVVCLGATILFSDVMKSGAVGLVQAVLVVSIVWFFAYFISRRLGVDQRSAMILSSGVSICGVSACITAARVAGGDDKKLSYIVSLVLIIVVPMIYMMPWLAHLLLPVLFDDPQVIQEWPEPGLAEPSIRQVVLPLPVLSSANYRTSMLLLSKGPKMF